MNSPRKASTETPVSPVKKVTNAKQTEESPREKEPEQETKTKAKPKAQKATKTGKAQSPSADEQTEEKVKGKSKAKAKKSIEEEVEEAVQKPKAKKGKKATEEAAEQKVASPKATAVTPTATKKRKREEENGEQTEETPKKKAKTAAPKKKGKKEEDEEVKLHMEVENGETVKNVATKKKAQPKTSTETLEFPKRDRKNIHSAFDELEDIIHHAYLESDLIETLHQGFARLRPATRILLKTAINAEEAKQYFIP